MLRYRRYRVFIVLAAISVFLLYRLSHRQSSWSSSAIHNSVIPNHFADEKNHYPNKDFEPSPDSLPPNDKPYIPDPPELPPDTKNKLDPPNLPPIPKPTQQVPPDLPKAILVDDDDADSTPRRPSAVVDDPELILAEGGEARKPHDATLVTPPIEVERWTARFDHFPVNTASIIPLPTGAGKPILKIQAKFEKESEADKQTRLQRLGTVKEAFLHAWNGYKKHAWGKDELRPVSGKNRNTFNGWSATLVDALDTMWIMGLKQEFEEAVDFVKTIDFHTSPRFDIPLFETTIRYLGGLIGAYDVSEGKYPVLLEKAVMLGDILMGAFDTPNRMPLTYFNWKSVFTSQPHRAPSRVVLAELGSLQMEFTRLAQLTGNNTYYDAITRIMNLLEEWQDNTGIPGLWPADIDTSGCNMSAQLPEYHAPNRQTETTFIYSGEEDRSYEVQKLSPIAQNTYSEQSKEKSPEMVPLEKPSPLVFEVKDKDSSKSLRKRQLGEIGNEIPANSIPDPSLSFADRKSEFKVQPDQVQIQKLSECVSKGLDYPGGGWGRYTLGSTADSAYEYLPKMYLLLNGQVENYRKMYEKAADAATENLLYRIMLPDPKRELYGAGEVGKNANYDEPDAEIKMESTHLTCFVGGMYGLGSKIFNRPKDLEIAKKLTDGCVWAYESTATGIMPETFMVVGCKDLHYCPWNQTRWYEEIDPYHRSREITYKQQMEFYNSKIAELKTATEEEPTAATRGTSNTATGARAVVTAAQEGARAPPKGFDPHAKPDGPKIIKHKDAKRPEDIKAPQPLKKRAPPYYKPPTPTVDDDSEASPPTFADIAPPAIYSPEPPLSMEEFAKQRIEEEKLKQGMKGINDPRYILRPEALESVWYMHRITGDPYWRKAGWKMVTSVLKATRTTYGHSSIKNVMSEAPEFDNEMESFWLAETLKYAWLIFEDESKWGLDDWVMNTEAHFFKRPKPVT